MVIIIMLMKCGNLKMDYFHFDCSGGFQTSRILAIMLMLSADIDFGDCHTEANTCFSIIIFINLSKQTFSYRFFVCIFKQTNVAIYNVLQFKKKTYVFHFDYGL